MVSPCPPSSNDHVPDLGAAPAPDVPRIQARSTELIAFLHDARENLQYLAAHHPEKLHFLDYKSEEMPNFIVLSRDFKNVHALVKHRLELQLTENDVITGYAPVPICTAHAAHVDEDVKNHLKKAAAAADAEVERLADATTKVGFEGAVAGQDGSCGDEVVEMKNSGRSSEKPGPGRPPTHDEQAVMALWELWANPYPTPEDPKKKLEGAAERVNEKQALLAEQESAQQQNHASGSIMARTKRKVSSTSPFEPLCGPTLRKRVKKITGHTWRHLKKLFKGDKSDGRAETKKLVQKWEAAIKRKEDANPTTTSSPRKKRKIAEDVDKPSCLEEPIADAVEPNAEEETEAVSMRPQWAPNTLMTAPNHLLNDEEDELFNKSLGLQFVTEEPDAWVHQMMPGIEEWDEIHTSPLVSFWEFSQYM